jgi:hypothetical protein
MKISKFLISAVSTVAVVGAIGVTYAQMGDNSVQNSNPPPGQNMSGGQTSDRGNAGMAGTNNTGNPVGSTSNDTSSNLPARSDRG